jgi:hypothetical protein
MMDEHEIRVIRELIERIEELDNSADQGISAWDDRVNAARKLIGLPPQ